MQAVQIVPGAQTITTIIANCDDKIAGSFLRTFASSFEGANHTREVINDWVMNEEEDSNYQRCDVSITRGDEVRSFTLILGEVETGSPGTLQVRTSPCRPEFNFMGDALLLRPDLFDHKLTRTVNQVAAQLFRGKGWTDASGKSHQSQCGATGDNKRKRSTGGRTKRMRR